MALCGGVLACVMYAINLRKWKVGYFVFGSILLAFLFINQAIHFRVFRDTKNIERKFQSDCPAQLRITPMQWVQKNCVCQKYIKKDDEYSTDCDANTLGVVWENDTDKSVDQQVNQRACLNLNCCGMLSNNYTLWFYALSLSTVSMQIFGFGVVAAMYYISAKPPFMNYQLFLTDFIFGAIITVTLIGGIIIYASSDFSSVPPEKPSRSSTFLELTDVQPLQLNSQSPIAMKGACGPL